MNTPLQYFIKARASKIVVTVLIALGITLSRASAVADVMFEGYYKVTISNVHSGYAIQKYEWDNKTKLFTSTYFVYVRTTPDGSKFTTESLVAKSNEKFQPVSYQYTALLEGKGVQVDAKFNNGKMAATVKQNGKATKKTKVLPKGSFLSTMLLQLIMQNGLKTGKGFSFNAMAEEDAEVYPGTANVEGESKYMGRDAFKLRYEFKGIKSIAYIDTHGEVLFSEAPAQSVSTELVTDPSQARLAFSFPEKTLKTLFGGIPTGQRNSLAEDKKKTSSATAIGSTDSSGSANSAKPTPTNKSQDESSE